MEYVNTYFRQNYAKSSQKVPLIIRPEALSSINKLYYLPRTFLAVLATFSAVKPNSLNSTL